MPKRIKNKKKEYLLSNGLGLIFIELIILNLVKIQKLMLKCYSLRLYILKGMTLIEILKLQFLVR